MDDIFMLSTILFIMVFSVIHKLATSLRVQSHLRLMCAISTVKCTEGGTYHFAWVPSPQFQV